MHFGNSSVQNSTGNFMQAYFVSRSKMHKARCISTIFKSAPDPRFEIFHLAQVNITKPDAPLHMNLQAYFLQKARCIVDPHWARCIFSHFPVTNGTIEHPESKPWKNSPFTFHVLPAWNSKNISSCQIFCRSLKDLRETIIQWCTTADVRHVHCSAQMSALVMFFNILKRNISILVCLVVGYLD